MQNHRKKHRAISSDVRQSALRRVFREEILELKYELWIARAKFVRGELDFEGLQQHAARLAEGIAKRYEQQFRQTLPSHLRQALSELRNEPCLLIHSRQSGK